MGDKLICYCSMNNRNILNFNNVFILLILITRHLTHGCLANLDCPCEVGPSNNVVINCNGRGLKSLPPLRLQNPNTIVEEINLSSNLITEIPASTFNHSSLKHLKKIDLSKNPLNRFHYDSFTGLEISLTELILSDLTSKYFYFVSLNLEKLQNLETLVLSNFKDQFIPNSFFKNLKKLKKISLKKGLLYSIDQNAFQDQQDSLQELDLSNNALKEVPTLSISKLKVLSKLILNSNSKINFKNGSFQTMSKLKVLEIDHTTDNVNPGSFSGLENSLEVINVGVNHWTDSCFSHISRLKNLIKIEAEYNLLTKLDILLDGKMKNLKHLNLEMNKIDVIDNSQNRIESQSLQTLNLERNPLSQVNADSFLYLTSLKSLNLKHAGQLKFQENTFISQRDTLESLSIDSSNINGPKWETLRQLHSLKQLKASKCDLPNIPKLNFNEFSNLETLFLNQNNIDNLTQTAFIGLGNSLIKLSLSENNLTTINRCAFEGLNQLNFLDLKIDKNPLICDCEMKWLFEKIDSLRNDPRNVPLIMVLQWKCQDLGIMFKDLKSSHFSICQESTACETIITHPPQTNTPSTSPYLDLHIKDVTADSFVVSLQPKVVDYSTINLLCYESLNRGKFVANISTKSELQDHKIINLKPSSEYTVLARMYLPNEELPIEVQSLVITQDKSTRKLIIIGTCVAVVSGILVLLGVLVCIIKCRKQTKLPVVEVTGQSKRFVKYNDSVRSSNENNYRKFHRDPDRHKRIEPIYTDDAIKSSLDKMSNEEKYNLVNLLTKSTEGLNDKSRDFSRMYGKGEYDEIPANYYEEI